MFDSCNAGIRARRPVLTAVAAVLLGACGAADAVQGTRGREHVPAADLPRIPSVALDGDDIGFVRDFELIGDTIYLLDMMGRVSIVERSGAALRLTGHFGRRGSGPGELSRPTGIARVGADLLIVDGTRLHSFDASGGARDTKWLELPCPMMLPVVSPARDGLFLSGGCLRRGVGTDTVKAVLAWSPDDGGSWTVVSEAARFTSDGTVGMAFGATALLTTGIDDRHVFGGGETNCIGLVHDAGGRPTVTERCPAAAELYSAEPPPEVKLRLRTSRVGGMNVEWPDPLPVFVERFVAGPGIVLFRAFSADSLVMQAGDPARHDIAVAPLNGLVGCKAAGCVWVMDNASAPRLIVLDRAAIEDLLGRGR